MKGTKNQSQILGQKEVLVDNTEYGVKYAYKNEFMAVAVYMGVPDATVEVFSHQVMLCDNHSFCVLLSRLNQSTDLVDVVRFICKWPPMKRKAF